MNLSERLRAEGAPGYSATPSLRHGAAVPFRGDGESHRARRRPAQLRPGARRSRAAWPTP